jgi:hypothetical protein
VGPRAGLEGAENLFLTRIRSPDSRVNRINKININNSDLRTAASVQTSQGCHGRSNLHDNKLAPKLKTGLICAFRTSENS